MELWIRWNSIDLLACFTDDVAISCQKSIKNLDSLWQNIQPVTSEICWWNMKSFQKKNLEKENGVFVISSPYVPSSIHAMSSNNAASVSRCVRQLMCRWLVQSIDKCRHAMCLHCWLAALCDGSGRAMAVAVVPTDRHVLCPLCSLATVL